jgi:plastocyanin
MSGYRVSLKYAKKRIVMIKMRLSLWSVAFGLLLSGCGWDNSDDNNDSSAGGSQTVEVAIVGPNTACDTGGSGFDPEVVTITVGQQVRWTNNTNNDHTVVSSSSDGSCGEAAALPVDQREMDSTEPPNPAVIEANGGVFVYTFDEPGTFDYVCTVSGHRMHGVVIVN